MGRNNMEFNIKNITSITRTPIQSINDKYVRDIKIETIDGQKINLECWAVSAKELIIKKDD